MYTLIKTSRECMNGIYSPMKLLATRIVSERQKDYSRKVLFIIQCLKTDSTIHWQITFPQTHLHYYTPKLVSLGPMQMVYFRKTIYHNTIFLYTYVNKLHETFRNAYPIHSFLCRTRHPTAFKRQNHGTIYTSKHCEHLQQLSVPSLRVPAARVH
jgi:hypothetical protein